MIGGEVNDAILSRQASVQRQSPELTLLLTVARILRARLPELAPAWQVDDLTALNEALAPFETTGNAGNGCCRS